MAANKSSKSKIVDIATELIDECLKNEEFKGIELYHIEYVKEGSDKVLRVYIDRDDGYISTDDCEKVSRYLSEALDDTDPIDQNYVLEVSSPGIDRTLYQEAHFIRYIGELVEVSLYREIPEIKKLSLPNPKKIEGILKSYDDGNIVIGITDSDKRDATIEIESRDIAKVNLAVII